VDSSPGGGASARSPVLHQQEAAGAVGILGQAGRETALPGQCALLVADQRGNRQAGQFRHCADRAEHAAAVDDRGQHGARDGEALGQQLVAPVAAMQVEEQRARGVAGIGDMRRAASQVFRA
jgi:hypothetical protein